MNDSNKQKNRAADKTAFFCGMLNGFRKLIFKAQIQESKTGKTTDDCWDNHN